MGLKAFIWDKNFVNRTHDRRNSAFWRVGWGTHYFHESGIRKRAVVGNQK